MSKQLTTTGSHLDRHILSTYLSGLQNASVIHGSGDLVYSQDPSPLKTTTSRLVVFQNIKKYLQLGVNSAAICYDPLNGGTDFERLFVVARVHENLYVVWDELCPFLTFKIPPMPWIENGTENSVIIEAMLAASDFSVKLSQFISAQKNEFQKLVLAKDLNAVFASAPFKTSWFKICHEMFHDKIKLRADGDSQRLIQYKGTNIKMRMAISEDQGSLPLSIDFSGTSLAQNLCSATHVVESGLLIELIKFYSLEGFLCQPILNSIKLILPPQSAVAKPTHDGLHNFELQKLCRQLIRQCLNEINSTARKELKKYLMYSTYLFAARPLQNTKSENRAEWQDPAWVDISYFSNSRVQMIDGPFQFSKRQNKDKNFSCQFSPKEDMHLFIRGISSADDKEFRHIRINDKIVDTGNFKLTPKDSIEISWTT